MDQFNPQDILNQHLGEEEAGLTSGFDEQESALRAHFQGFIDQMQQQYRVERKYLEQTPMDFEQRNAKVRDLNKKYEMQALKLQQQAQPNFLNLEQQRIAARTKLNTRRQQGAQRLQLVQDLLQSGHIPEENRAAVMQEQLQAVGLNVPLAMFKPPKTTPMDRLKMVRSELEFIGDATSPFVPKRDGGEMFNKDGTLRKDVRFVEAEGTKGRPLTEAERVEASRLFAYQRQLQSERTRLLGELQTGRLTRAMDTAGNQQSTPFADGIRKQVQVPTAKPKDDPLGLGL